MDPPLQPEKSPPMRVSLRTGTAALAGFVTDTVLIANVLTYGTLAVELALGILVWNRVLRPWVLLLGVTYKPDIADVRESPAFAVARLLRHEGATVTYHDPLVPEWHLDGDVLTAEPDLPAALAAAHVVVLLQNHTSYDLDELSARAARLFDTRGVTRPGGAVERL